MSATLREIREQWERDHGAVLSSGLYKNRLAPSDTDDLMRRVVEQCQAEIRRLSQHYPDEAEAPQRYVLRVAMERLDALKEA